MSFFDSLRHQLMRFKGEEALLREIFRIVERRGCTKRLEGLLAFDKVKSWQRTWAESASDANCLWQSERHGLPDRRTPLHALLQASPRHALLARHRSDATALKALAKYSVADPHSLSGMSASLAADLPLQGSTVPKLWSRAAITGLERWRRIAAKSLLRAGGPELVAAKDHAGRTALHYAAGAPTADWGLIQSMLEAGADPRSVDDFGRTAAHYSALNGNEFILKELLAATPGEPAKDCHGRCPMTTFARHLGESNGGVDVVVSSISLEDLFNDFISVNRPVLIKGGAAACPATSSWTHPESVRKSFEDLPLSVGLTPYEPGGRKTTLGDFLAKEQAAAGQPGSGLSGPRPYVFDVSVGRHLPEVLGSVQLVDNFVRDQNLAYLRQPQFGVGFSGAGAPMHTHYSALNGLFEGSKEWWLLRPSSSFWSFDPSAVWANSEELAALRQSGTVLELHQSAGDLIFVPEFWGHATLLHGFGIGVGQEFITNQSLAA